MKRTIAASLLVFIVLPANANEIAGTRVAGQGAICAEGQGKAVEYNIALSQETSYCYEREPIAIPTQEQLEAKAREQIERTIAEQKNANAETVIAETSVTAEVIPIDEPLTAIEINVTTGVATVREYTQAEKEQAALDRAGYEAQQNARQQAQQAAKTNQGVEQCVNWSAGGSTGQECSFEPIPATEEEVEEQYNFLYQLFDFNWLGFLSLFVWN